MADDLPFTAEHMAQLEVLIKLMRRSRSGLLPQQVAAAAEALERLRDSVVAEGRLQSERGPSVIEPVPFVDPLHGGD